MNEWCIYIALYCVLLYTQSALQTWGGVGGGFSSQPPNTFSSIDNKLADVCRQGVEDEEEEDSQDSQNDQSNNVLLVLLPDKEHKGFQGVHKPVEGCLGAA